jgi:CBS domain-containing protein
VGATAAFAVTALIMPRSILTEKLARRGHHITREYSIDLFEFARVRDVMDQKAPMVPGTMKVTELSDRLANGDTELNRRQGILVVDDAGRLSGIVTRGDIMRALRRVDVEQVTVGEIGEGELTVTYPDEPLNTALSKMLSEDVGRLPVVDRNDPKRIVGYLGRACILSARRRLHEEENIREKC